MTTIKNLLQQLLEVIILFDMDGGVVDSPSPQSKRPKKVGLNRVKLRNSLIVVKNRDGDQLYNT